MESLSLPRTVAVLLAERARLTPAATAYRAFASEECRLKPPHIPAVPGGRSEDTLTARAHYRQFRCWHDAEVRRLPELALPISA